MKEYNKILPKKQFSVIKNTLMGSDFPWYYNNMVNTEKDNMFQFTHTFYSNNKINSAFFNLLNPILNFLNPISIIRVKGNLLTKNNKNIEHGFHTDYDNQDKITTGIFYINTNNGYTKFKNGKVVKSEENKYIEFNSTESHTGATCTDENTRVVINFNYIK